MHKKQKPNILVMTSTFPRWEGDAQSPFVFLLSKHLSEYFNVSILCPHSKGSLSFEIYHGLEVHRFKYLPESLETLAYEGGILPKLNSNKLNYLQIPFFLLSQFVKLVELNKIKKYDLIFAHWVLPQGLIAVIYKLFNGNVKILVTAHGSDLLGFRGLIGRFLKRCTLKNIDQLTVVSNKLKSEAIKCGYNGNTYIYPMGIDTEMFSKDKYSLELRGKFNVKFKYILFVGRLVENKGLQYLIDAMITVVNKFPDIKLIVIGDGPYRYSLESQVKIADLGDNVIFTGSIPHEELPQFYATADIFVGPSVELSSGEGEGLGMVFLEAMSCGTPVVATNLPGISDIVIDGVTGYTVGQRSSEEIAEKLLRLIPLTKTEHTTISAAHDIVINKFKWINVAMGYRRLILEMILHGKNNQ